MIVFSQSNIYSIIRKRNTSTIHIWKTHVSVQIFNQRKQELSEANTNRKYNNINKLQAHKPQSHNQNLFSLFYNFLRHVAKFL